MEQILKILEDFTPIFLKEMDGVKLMERRDIKYIFREDQLPSLLHALMDGYRVLEVNGKRANRYQTLYFDTPDFFLYHQHHNKRVNRFKVRMRKYVESNHVFFEIKFKNNHGKVIKDRIVQHEIEERIDDDAETFLIRKTPLAAESLEAKFWVNYSRITLVNKSQPERVTIDVGLNYVNGTKQKAYDGMVIAEVKQASMMLSPFMQLMKNQKIRRASISKYCLGVMSLVDDIKSNRFKPKLLYLNKILYAAAGNCQQSR